MTLREITIINTIVINKYNFFICPILPALSSTIISLSLWTSSFIAVEQFKRRKLKPDPILPNIYRCTSDDFEWSENTWKIIDKILTREYLHIGVPCLLHLISTIFISTH
ncbi:unnamed protein product, partial [Rotaria sordida]